MATQPSKSALDDPTTREDGEPLLFWVAFDDFKCDIEGCKHPVRQTRLAIDAIRPATLRRRHELLEQMQELSGAMIILDVGCMDYNCQEVAQGIGDDVTFAAADLCAGIIAAHTARLRCFHTLTVHDCCARLWLASLLLAA